MSRAGHRPASTDEQPRRRVTTVRAIRCTERLTRGQRIRLGDLRTADHPVWSRAPVRVPGPRSAVDGTRRRPRRRSSMHLAPSTSVEDQPMSTRDQRHLRRTDADDQRVTSGWCKYVGRRATIGRHRRRSEPRFSAAVPACVDRHRHPAAPMTRRASPSRGTGPGSRAGIGARPRIRRSSDLVNRRPSAPTQAERSAAARHIDPSLRQQQRLQSDGRATVVEGRRAGVAGCHCRSRISTQPSRSDSPLAARGRVRHTESSSDLGRA